MGLKNAAPTRCVFQQAADPFQKFWVGREVDSASAENTALDLLFHDGFRESLVIRAGVHFQQSVSFQSSAEITQYNIQLLL